MSDHALLLLLLLLLLVPRIVLNRELQLAVFPAGPQPRASAGSVPRRTSTASQKKCQIERQKECQKICQKECQKMCQKECQKIWQIELIDINHGIMLLFVSSCGCSTLQASTLSLTYECHFEQGRPSGPGWVDWSVLLLPGVFGVCHYFSC